MNRAGCFVAGFGAGLVALAAAAVASSFASWADDASGLQHDPNVRFGDSLKGVYVVKWRCGCEEVTDEPDMLPHDCPMHSGPRIGYGRVSTRSVGVSDPSPGFYPAHPGSAL